MGFVYAPKYHATYSINGPKCNSIGKISLQNRLLYRLYAENNLKFLKTLNLFDAVTELSFAWKRISKESIAKCWKNLLIDEEFDEEDNIPLASLLHDEVLDAQRRGLQLINNLFPKVKNTNFLKREFSKIFFFYIV